MSFKVINVEHEDYMQLAIEEASKGLKKKHGGPFGAVIVKDGKVIARAHNTVLKNNNPTQHAEINAISNASKKLKRFDLSECTIYVTVEPCPMCLSAIHWAKITTVVFGATVKDAHKCGFNEIPLSNKDLNKLGHLNITLIPGILKKECKALFEVFKKNKISTY